MEFNSTHHCSCWISSNPFIWLLQSKARYWWRYLPCHTGALRAPSMFCGVVVFSQKQITSNFCLWLATEKVFSQRKNTHFNFSWSVPQIRLVLEHKLSQLPLGVVLPMLVLFSCEGLCLFVSKLDCPMSKQQFPIPPTARLVLHWLWCSSQKEAPGPHPASSHQPRGASISPQMSEPRPCWSAADARRSFPFVWQQNIEQNA